MLLALCCRIAIRLIPTKYALKHKLLEAFTCDAFNKLEDHENQATELTEKALKSALINAEARRAPGIKFVKAYADCHIFNSLTVEKAAVLMVKHYKELPQCLWYEQKLYSQICHESTHYELLLELYPKVIYQCSDDMESAEVKYRMVKLALEQFKLKKQVKTPNDVPTMLQEAADTGHAEARSFINCSEGKAILNRIGFNSSGNYRKNTAAKEKQKRKRKLAKKAKRK